MTDWATDIAAQLWCKPAHSAKEMDVAFATDIAAALRKARADGMRDLANVVHAYRDSPTLMKAIDDTINSPKDKQP
jgi:hypothetical protein